MYKYRRDLNTKYPPSHHHNAFMVTGGLGHTHARLHIAGIQETRECSTYLLLGFAMKFLLSWE